MVIVFGIKDVTKTLLVGFPAAHCWSMLILAVVLNEISDLGLTVFCVQS